MPDFYLHDFFLRLKHGNWKRLFMVFLFAILIIDVCQVIFTEVMSDEAYYYLWGQRLDWGYYDHPPMVALLTWISQHLMPWGNFAVRFATLIAHTITLILVWKIIDEKEPDGIKVSMFFLISVSLTMFSIYGFVTTPDVALLLFTAVFLYLYQLYLKQNSFFTAILMGIAMALMLYSKYHAILIIGLIILSDPKLLIQGKAWTSIIVTILLMIPHLLWQINSGFPSFQYHLIDRSDGFGWIYLLEYFPLQLLVFNPVILFITLIVLIKNKPNDVFERGLYFIIFGFLIFFWLMTLRGHVEPHWTVSASLPIIILLYRACTKEDKLRHKAFIWITPTLLLLIVGRIFLTCEPLSRIATFGGNAHRYDKLYEQAEGRPVVFRESFQQPTNYQFFTKGKAFVLSNIYTRHTQYDIWQDELNYQGKEVLVYDDDSTSHIIHHFQSVNRIRISYNLENSDFQANDTLRIPLKVSNPTDYPICFDHNELPVSFSAIYNTGEDIIRIPVKIAEKHHVLPPHTSIEIHASTVIPGISGEALFSFSLYNNLCYAYNAPYCKIIVR